MWEHGEILDRWLTKNDISSEAFAELIRQLRRHPKSPGALLVRQWRCGAKAPGHDMKLFIELATGGGVPLVAWGQDPFTVADGAVAHCRTCGSRQGQEEGGDSTGSDSVVDGCRSCNYAEG